MGGGSGGSGSGGRSGGGAGSGDAGQPAPGTPESDALERQLYRQSKDAWFKEKDYKKSNELERQYKAVRDANEKAKAAQPTKPINWSKATFNAGGPSVRDEGPSGKQMTNAQVAARAKKLGKYNPPKGKPIGLER